jgi:hypothetical protein
MDTCAHDRTWMVRVFVDGRRPWIAHACANCAAVREDGDDAWFDWATDIAIRGRGACIRWEVLPPHPVAMSWYAADTREYIARLKSEVDELRGALKTDDELLANKDLVLDALECDAHGRCVPGALEKIVAMRLALGWPIPDGMNDEAVNRIRSMAKEMPARSGMVKVTEFHGIPSGDGECFCFCRCGSDAEHAEHDAKAREMCVLDEMSEDYDPYPCRLYPNDLLPVGADGKRGRWRITVEFDEAPDG